MLKPGQPIELDHTIVPEATFRLLSLKQHNIKHALADCFLITHVIGKITIILPDNPTVTFHELKKWQVDHLSQGKNKIVVSMHYKECVYMIFEVEPLNATNAPSD